MAEQNVLEDITEIKGDIKLLFNKLYGNENDPGDIPEIKAQVQKTNGCVREHETDIAILKTEMKAHYIDHGNHSATVPMNETSPIPSATSGQGYKYIGIIGLPPSLAASIGILGKFANWW